MQNKILITGASGFVGRFLVNHLLKVGLKLKVLTREYPENYTGAEVHLLPYGSPIINWPTIVKDCSTVIHLLARVHIMKDKSTNPLTEFRKINVDITNNLARESVKQGVRRFIFLSSIKVNGEFTIDRPFNEFDIPKPADAYAISKWEAEETLKKICKNTSMEFVIIRSPLVYGPGVKANFLRLIKFVNIGFPLPLASIQNKRSLISIYNLIDFIAKTISNPLAANETFLISDDHDISTTLLLNLIAQFSGKPSRLFAISPRILAFILNIAGRKDMNYRLLGSLEIDITKAKKVLAWSPPITLKQGLKATVAFKYQEF